MSQEIEFTKALSMVAEICGRQLSKDAIIFYFDNLKDLGVEKVTNQIKKMGLGGKLPTINEIRNALGADIELDPKLEATHAAERIWTAIGKFGGYNWPEAAEYIGELGVAIVKTTGGWVSLCEYTMESHKVANIAQWRDLGMSIAERRKVGLTEGPSLPPLPHAAESTKLLE